MKNDLACEVVRDLLPSYIDHLTSEETSKLIEAHLGECEACREAHREMTGGEPPKAEEPEIDYLKKVRSFGKRLRRIAILAGCAVIALAVAAVWITKASRKQAAADAEAITALQESEEELKKQIELPTVLYDAETGVLVVTGTGDYDQAVIPDEAENAKTLDVQDDEFHLSVQISFLDTGGEPLKTYLPAYMDRTDRSLDLIKSYLKEHAGSAYPVESASKMADLSIRKGNKYAYSHETDRIFVNLRDYGWHREEIYLLALMDGKHMGWGQLGYAWYVGLVLDPYAEIAMIDFDPKTVEELPGYLRICSNAGMRFENLTGEDFRIQFDAVARYCIEKGLTGWGTAYESMPLATTRLCKNPVQEDASMSVYMAASFVARLVDTYGFEAVSEFCFGQKTFEEAFGTDFTTAFEAWKTWIAETYPIA